MNERGCFWLGGGFIVVIVLSVIMNGWAISTLWAWFVVPIFALPTLGIAQAIGLSCLVGLFRQSSTNSDKAKDTTDALATALGQALVTPVITVGLGWVIHLFM